MRRKRNGKEMGHTKSIRARNTGDCHENCAQRTGSQTKHFYQFDTFHHGLGVVNWEKTVYRSFANGNDIDDDDEVL